MVNKSVGKVVGLGGLIVKKKRSEGKLVKNKLFKHWRKKKNFRKKFFLKKICLQKGEGGR